MARTNKKKGARGGGISPKEVELLCRARVEGKALSYAKGFPDIVDIPAKSKLRDNRQKKSGRHNALTHVPALKLGVVEMDYHSILGPAADLIHMVEALELYATRCSEELSWIERCREDCTHELELRNCGGKELTDETVLAIGKKLQLISEERRAIKNRFEIVKLVKRHFESKAGQEALSFLLTVMADETRVRNEQSQRTYFPRTDILDDLYDRPLPKYAPPPTREPAYDGFDHSLFSDVPEKPTANDCTSEYLESLLDESPELAFADPFEHGDDIPGNEVSENV